MKRRSVNKRLPETVPPKKYLIIICLSYCFMGANFLISGVFVSYPYNADYKALIILVLFFCAWFQYHVSTIEHKCVENYMQL